MSEPHPLGGYRIVVLQLVMAQAYNIIAFRGCAQLCMFTALMEHYQNEVPQARLEGVEQSDLIALCR